MPGGSGPAGIRRPIHYCTRLPRIRRRCPLPRCERLTEARALFAESLAARRTALGDADPATLTSLNHLGLILRELGELDEARALLSEAVQTRRTSQGDRHPETLTAINNLGALLKACGDLSAAEPLYVEALAVRRAELGDRHPDTLTSINNLASLYTAQGKLDEAEPLVYEAAATAREVLGADHPHTKIFASNLQRQLNSRQGSRAPIFTQPTESEGRSTKRTPNATPRANATPRKAGIGRVTRRAQTDR